MTESHTLLSTTDFMQIALDQAKQAVGLSSPNPRVGCVIVKDQKIIGRGFTQAAGQAHAEVIAIRDAQAQGHDLMGSDFYVTLEPCSHFGRTPPCALAIQEVHPHRVVVALLDANPQVSGQGVAQLRAAGIEVEVLPETDLHAQAAHELNIGFIQRMTHQQVFTRMKMATSADGKTALLNGYSQWITTDAARQDGHSFRARADVIVTGVGTLRKDNPQLNVRGIDIAHPPIKCVVDTWARTPVDAHIFDDGAPVWLACGAYSEGDEYDERFEEQAIAIAALKEAHPQLSIIGVPMTDRRVDLKTLWSYFNQQSINEVHVEAGAVLNAALLEAQLVDEVVMYMAPRIIGSGFSAAQFDEGNYLDILGGEPKWQWHDVTRVGQDVRLILRKSL